MNNARCIWTEGIVPLSLLPKEASLLFSYDLHPEGRTMLAPFKRLLQETRDVWSRWDWVRDFAAELNTLLPGTAPTGPTVFDISLGISEVRLNREIQWGFRLLHFLTRIVRELSQSQPVVLILNGFQHADRLTVLALYHMLHNVKLERLLVVLQHPSETAGHAEDLLKRFRHKAFPLVLQSDSLLPQPTPTAVLTNHALREQASAEPDSIADCLSELDRGICNTASQLKRLHDCLSLYNLEHVLLLADRLEARLPSLPPEEAAVARVEIQRHRGIALTFMERLPEASTAFERMYEAAPTTAHRVKACHFLACLHGKRLGDWDAAKRHIEQGLSLSTDATDFRTVYERGWLLNYHAFVTYRVDRDFRRALAVVLEAYALVKPHLHVNRTVNILDEVGEPIMPLRLIGNLTANVAYLHYHNGSYRHALTTYRAFHRIYKRHLMPIHHKEDYYFLGHIHLELEEFEEAEHCYRRALELCEQHADPFHSELVTRNLGYCAYRKGDFDEATRWYERALALKREVGELNTEANLRSLELCRTRPREDVRRQLERGPLFLITSFSQMDL